VIYGTVKITVNVASDDEHIRAGSKREETIETTFEKNAMWFKVLMTKEAGRYYIQG